MGDNGKGVRVAAQALRDAGVARVDEVLYPRHAPRGSSTNRSAAGVMADVLAWLEARIAQPRRTEPAPSEKGN